MASWICPNCSTLFTTPRVLCPYCSTYVIDQSATESTDCDHNWEEINLYDPETGEQQKYRRCVKCDLLSKI